MALHLHVASHFRAPPLVYLAVGVTCLGSIAFWRASRNSGEAQTRSPIPSPKDTILPHISKEEIRNLPYPPDALPGARDVDSPYGSIRVYEWGPEEGARILLIHGISTPSIALGGLAHRLVEKGFRVMLFDLFGRGYSSAPSPSHHPYNSALYISQISICLLTSPIPWPTFSIIGYSLGGALAADFASYFPSLVRGLVLIAPGGLIRTKHITWKSRLLYSTSGLVPEWLTERLVTKRLWTGPEVVRSIEPESDVLARAGEEDQGGLRSRAVYASSHTRLLPGNANSTVGKVVDWQIEHHRGFVPAFISSIRHAPIHEQQHRWRILGAHLEKRSTAMSEMGERGLDQAYLILGEKDPIIIADELVQDAKEVLGEKFVRVHVFKGAGHEVAIQNGNEIAELVGAMLSS